jgi:large subunit ribosomal protein LP2
MRYISAYLLAVLGGNANPTPADLTKIMASVGIDCDAENCKKVIEALKGKNIEQVIEEGTCVMIVWQTQIFFFKARRSWHRCRRVHRQQRRPPPRPAASQPRQRKKVCRWFIRLFTLTTHLFAEKKEEKKKEESEEEEGDMGFGLFD